MKTAVVVLAEGFEEIEAVTPIDLLRRAGIRVVVAGLASRQVAGARGVSFLCDSALEATPSDWDVLVLPGGMPGAQNLASSKLLKQCIDNSLERGVWVAAICAAPALVLGAQGYLRNRQFTCYPGDETKVVDGHPSADPVVVDGPFVTSRGVGTAPAFALKLIELLVGAEKSLAVAKAVLLA